jgi:hypothetical protein
MIMQDIFEARIIPKRENITLDKICTEDETDPEHCLCSNFFCERNYRNDEDNLLIETGFNIFIYFLYMKELYPEEVELFKFEFEVR